jgi:hypothetical protein
MTRYEIQKKYKENNREKVNNIQRIWREKNKAKISRDRREYRRKIYNEQKEKVKAFKVERGCFKCGIKIPCVLSFHHKDPFTKKYQISDIIGKKPWRVIEAEMNKCEVVCCNCHSIIHDT